MTFQDILIYKNTTVLDALKVLDRTGKRVLFVVEENNEIIGAVSDGDIRRWLLKQGELSAIVDKISNKNPVFLSIDDKEIARKFMREKHVDVLPLTKNKRIVDIVYLYENEEIKQKNIDIPVVLMAGGKGTRLYPYTKILPKPLIPIGDIPISEHIVKKFREYGCNEFFFIVNYKKNMIKAYYNEIEKDYKVTFVDENEPLGTGGGISLLKGLINSSFILTNCDTIINDEFEKIVDEHKKRGNSITMICSLRNFEVPYGVVEIGENGSIKSMKEKPNMSFFTNTGTYIVEPSVMDAVASGENIGFPDVIKRIMKMGEKVGVYPISENAWLDMGQFDTMENMKQKLNIKEE